MVADLIDDILEQPLQFVLAAVLILSVLGLFSYANSIAMNEARECLESGTEESVCAYRQ